MVSLRVSFWSTAANQTSRPACPAAFFLAGVMDGNGKFQYVLLENVDEYQTFCRRKDAMDITSVLEKYCVWGHSVVGSYNHERLHQALGYRTPAQVYGVAAAPPVALCASSPYPGDESSHKLQDFCLDFGKGFKLCFLSV